jgi:acyl-coenzyme A synthetase/AMP-(fatty) acid ligase
MESGSGHRHSPAAEEKQLLVDIVDELALVKPHAAYAYYPVSTCGYDQGYRKISNKQFANAVNGLAWWLTAQIGKSITQETLSYAGPNDFRQNALILACSKVGYIVGTSSCPYKLSLSDNLQLLLASPRNQHVALQSLFSEVHCKALLTANPESDFSRTVQEAYSMASYHVPTVENLMNEAFPHYRNRKSFNEAKDDPLVILHTSGTTALPKPITYTQDWAAAYIKTLQMRPSSDNPNWELKDLHFRGTRLLVMMPPFHAANIFCTSFLGPACGTTIIFPPANLPPTVESFLGAVKSTQVDTAFTPPHLISPLAANKSHLDTVSENLTAIMSGGGKVVQAHGDLVASRIKLITFYGATEVGSIPDHMPVSDSSETWHYMNPHPAAGWEFRFHKEAENQVLYEAHIVRSKDPDLEQPVFKIYKDRDEYATRDLFFRHPRIPEMWKWCGRIDDTISLGTGANVCPITMENGLSKVPDLQGVLMVGNGCTRPLLIIEPRVPCQTLDSKEVLVERIWGRIEELNIHYCEDHRILKGHVIVTDAATPMVRSLKGSVQRSATVAAYEDEISRLFA